MPEPRHTFASDFKRFFGRGLGILLPSILTLWLLWYAFAFVFNSVAVPINRGIRWSVIQVAPAFVDRDPQKQPSWYRVTEAERKEFLALPEGKNFRSAATATTNQEIRFQKVQRLWQSRWYLSGSGLVVAIILIYLAGLMLGGLIGRRIYARLEAWISRVPGFKQVYPHVKQLVNLIMGDSGKERMAFKRVVLVEYPRKGIWTVGLVTSTSLRSVSERAEGAVLAVFIPSTPTPFTGFVISVLEREIVDLPISIDEALRFVLTGGVLIPDKQKLEPLPPRTEPSGHAPAA